jgi:hypothetical protein
MAHVTTDASIAATTSARTISHDPE